MLFVFFSKCNLHGSVTFAGRSQIWYFVCCWVMNAGVVLYFQRSFVIFLPFLIVLCTNRSARFGNQTNTNTPNHSDFYRDTAIEIMIISLILFWKLCIYYKFFSAVFLIYVNRNFGRELERWISSKCIPYSLSPS